MAGKFYIVGTPIGNLGDMTFRAVETLKAVDFIACEDTRHSVVLLNHFAIKKPLISYHMHNEHECGDKLMSLLDNDKNIALISDAGMPCISDPGALLVAKLRERGYDVCVVPGATAVASAVALCGLRAKEFTFIGFLPQKNKDRIAALAPYKKVPSTLAFYCSPHDINEDARFLFAQLGDRRAYAVKEITKMFEGVTVHQLSDFCIENPRGEFVLLIEGFDFEIEVVDLSIEDEVKKLMAEGADKKTAIKEVAKRRKLAKDEVYKIAHEIS